MKAGVKMIINIEVIKVCIYNLVSRWYHLSWHNQYVCTAYLWVGGGEGW